MQDKPASRPLGQHVAEVTKAVLHGTYGAVSIHTAHHTVLLAATHDLAFELDQQQVVIGHGPIFSVLETGTPTVVADTHDNVTLSRWPVFSPILSQSGIRSLLCFPLVFGAATAGAITSYSQHPGHPHPDTYVDGLVLATLATEIILQIQAGIAEDDIARSLEPGIQNHAIIQQAVGLVAEDLSISVVEAMIRIRAHAFGSNQALLELARRLISGETSLER